MRIATLLAATALCLSAAATAQTPRSFPQPLPIVDTIPAARDVPFPGVIRLKVDATDVAHGVFKVEQQVPVPAAGPMTLLFPKWLPGNHAPSGQIEKVAGLVISANGQVLQWKRDPLDMFAFTVDVPAGVAMLDVRFQFLSATAGNQGRIAVTSDLISLQPNSVSLYPAGYFTRQIPVSTTVTWPAGWKAAGALREAARSGDSVTYETTDYETLVDSPFLAGRHMKQWDLGQNVRLNVFADAARFLEAKPEQVEAHKKLVEQAVKLFGTRQFDRYEFLLSLSEKLGGIGLEHHRSSENGVETGYFLDWEKGPGDRDLLPHEFTHSWNGKHRRGADLFTPDFRTPMRNSMLWVYEGQTQFWGNILSARSGLISKSDILDSLALDAATYDNRRAREWRSLDDTTNDPIISRRSPKGWVSYQRSEDYYVEGMLVWFEVDAILRRETAGKRGMDDFARAFFGTGEGDWGTVTYDFDTVVKTLQGVAPYDWSGFLTKRLTEKAAGAPLGGFTMSGYQLTYTDKPTAVHTSAMGNRKSSDLAYSGGLVVSAGKLVTVLWGSAAYDAGLTVGDEIIAVNDLPYADAELTAAITAAKGTTTPIRLLVKTEDRVRSVNLAWHGGLRYPRFTKTGKGVTAIDTLLAPRK